MDWERTCMEGVERVVLETLDQVSESLEAYVTPPHDRRLLTASFEDLRQLRGALSMMAFDKGARLLAQAERLAGALLEDRGVTRDAPRTLWQAVRQLREYLAPADEAPGASRDLAHVTQALEACCAAADIRAEAPAPADEDEAHHVGEWVPGGHTWRDDRGSGAAHETGMSIAQIKSNLKSVVQIMPQWWEDLRDERHLEALNHAFAVIAERAETLNLSEIAKLAALLERLVARVNDDMISVTVEMMYGVIEQGVLKLGILFLQHCRPNGSPQDSAAREKLEKALAGMQLLTHQVDSVAPQGAPRQALRGALEETPAAQFELDGADEGQPGGWGVGGFGHRRLEDLFVEANLLHSQLTPRLQMMRRQHGELKRELSRLQGVDGAEEAAAGEGEWTWHRDEPAGLFDRIAAMTKANDLLAKLIADCEECLDKSRRATHELQDAILGGVTQTLS
ncbi:MAG TPA: hypothetical protein VKA13_07225 [Gammaproteobacteria bacterium]|nr:hypothetical protein [Gammaproteobacteria bacterium]